MPQPERGAGHTALGAAICRLIEQCDPAGRRLFGGPAVGGLVGGALRPAMRLPVLRRQVDVVLGPRRPGPVGDLDGGRPTAGQARAGSVGRIGKEPAIRRTTIIGAGEFPSDGIRVGAT